MDLRDTKDMEKDLKNYKKEMNALDMKMFLSKIGSIGFISISALIGLVGGNMANDLLRWMFISLGSGVAASMPLITEYIKAKEIYKTDKREVEILTEKLTSEKEKELTREKAKTNDRTYSYSYKRNENNIPENELYADKSNENYNKNSKKR